MKNKFSLVPKLDEVLNVETFSKLYGVMRMLLSLFGLLEASADKGRDQKARLMSDAFPDVQMTNQFGESLRFRRDFIDPGGAVVISTMYATCRGSCPFTSATIQSLRTTLSPSFGKRMTYLSISLEPEQDSPAVLRQYAGIYGAAKKSADLSDWHFLNMLPEDMKVLRRSLGFFELDPRVDLDPTQHAALLLVGNIESDRWCKLPTQLREPVMLDSIRRVAGLTFEQRYGISR